MSTTHTKSNVCVWCGDAETREFVCEVARGETLESVCVHVDTSIYKYAYTMVHGELQKPTKRLCKKLRTDVLFSSLPGLCPEYTSRPIGGLEIKKWMHAKCSFARSVNIAPEGCVTPKIDKI